MTVEFDFDDPTAARSKAEVKALHERSLKDLEAVVQTTAGYRAVLELLRWAQLLRPTYSDDARRSAFQEGHRNFGLRLARFVTEASPAISARMINDLLQEVDNGGAATKSAGPNAGK